MPQGMSGRVEGTNTMMFINREDTPTARWRYITYGIVVVSYIPEKKDPKRTIITVGGNRVHQPGDFGTTTVTLLTVKLLLNIVIFIPGDRYMKLDTKNFLSQHSHETKWIHAHENQRPTQISHKIVKTFHKNHQGWLRIQLIRRAQ